MISRLRLWFTPQRGASLLAVALVIYVIYWEVHHGLFTGTTEDGGDAHLPTAWWLSSHLGPTSMTGWYSGWYDGFPVYSYYFVLPDLLAAIAGHIISFNVAFKVATMLGSFLLPVAAWTMGKLFGAPHPIPEALAGVTLPFLFDASYTIAGGNLFSSFAGEYSFSLSLSLALITIGLFARGVRTGRGRWWAALFLSLTLAAHLLPWFWAIVMATVLGIMELVFVAMGRVGPNRNVMSRHARRAVWFVVSAGALSAGLSAWWLLPYATTQQYTTSMGYVNYSTSSYHSVLTQLGWFNATGGWGGDWIWICLALVAVFMAFFWMDRLGIFLTLSAAIALVAYVADPQSVIWNERLVPFWYISIFLSAGWLVGRTLHEVAQWIPRSQRSEIDLMVAHEGANRPDLERTVRVRRGVEATYVVLILSMVTFVPGLIPSVSNKIGLAQNANVASDWANYNFSGYQSRPAWHEYEGVIHTMERVAHRYGCGQSMWEYGAGEGRFGTPMALMLLPYWTNNCVGSMEGLYFEDSPTTPYHFLNQAELSDRPSEAMLGLDYGPTDVKLGVEHLQMLGVKYYFAYSPDIIKAANADPSLQLVATTRRFKVSGTRWYFYRVKDAATVVPLANYPNVLNYSADGRISWLNANEPWYLDANRWPVLMAATGPANWPRVVSSSIYFRRPAPHTVVSDVRIGTSSLSFHVSKIGTPVEVKVSYFPRWHAIGADGPYRVSPNLMVVVPTSHTVQLVYGESASNVIGYWITLITGLFLVAAAWRRRPWRRPLPSAAPSREG